MEDMQGMYAGVRANAEGPGLPIYTGPTLNESRRNFTAPAKGRQPNRLPTSHATRGMSTYPISGPSLLSARRHRFSNVRRCAGVNLTARSATDTTRADGACHVGNGPPWTPSAPRPARPGTGPRRGTSTRRTGRTPDRPSCTPGPHARSPDRPHHRSPAGTSHPAASPHTPHTRPRSDAPPAPPHHRPARPASRHATAHSPPHPLRSLPSGRPTHPPPHSVPQNPTLTRRRIRHPREPHLLIPQTPLLRVVEVRRRRQEPHREQVGRPRCRHVTRVQRPASVTQRHPVRDRHRVRRPAGDQLAEHVQVGVVQRLHRHHRTERSERVTRHCGGDRLSLPPVELPDRNDRHVYLS